MPDAQRHGAPDLILAAAARRDAVSDVRDASADRRDRERDLADMLDVGRPYGDHWHLRREAALDRRHARGDRLAARADREALARFLLEPDG